MICDDLSDSEIVQKVVADPRYFACIVEAYESKLRRYVSRVARFSATEIDDVLQESFLLIYRNINDYDSSLKFQSWIYRIVHNKAIDCWRKKMAQGRIKRDLYFEWTETQKSVEKMGLFLPEQKVSTRDELSSILDAINLLPEDIRSVLVLRFWEEKDYEEISDILRIPIGTVGSVINRAKKVLAKKLKRG